MELENSEIKKAGINTKHQKTKRPHIIVTASKQEQQEIEEICRIINLPNKNNNCNKNQGANQPQNGRSNTDGINQQRLTQKQTPVCLFTNDDILTNKMAKLKLRVDQE